MSTATNRGDVTEGSYLSTVITVGTTEVEAKVGGSRLFKRQVLEIYNDSNQHTIYRGPTGVTTSGATKGLPIPPGGKDVMVIGDVAVFLIGPSSGISVIIQERA